MHNVFSNKTILCDNLDFWCQLVVIRFVKTLSKRRMFVSSMKISAWWLLHRWIKFNKICWEKRPAKTRPNLRTSFWRLHLKNTQPHLKWMHKSSKFEGSGLPLIICTRHVRVPDFVKFRSIHFNFLVPERYAHLSGTWKMKMAKQKVEGTPTVGLILKKWGLYRSDSLVPIHRLPVPGGKLWIGTNEALLVYRNIIFEVVMSLQTWCNPLFETQSATHWFLQHLLVRSIVFYSTSNSIKTRLIKWKQGPGIQSWISKLWFLISTNH